MFFNTGHIEAGPGYIGAVNSEGPLGGIFSLATLIPALAVGARRLHDTNRSGWWQLLHFLPLIGSIILIVFFAQGPRDENRFGAPV